jgi:hypothetical protein
MNHYFEVSYEGGATDIYMIDEKGVMTFTKGPCPLNVNERQDIMALSIRIRDWLKGNSGISITVKEDK